MIALQDIGQRLRTICARGSTTAQAIVPYSYAGTMGLVQGEGMAARFFNRLGAARLERTICAAAGGEGLMHTLGAKVGMHVEFFAESRLILIWGSNSIGSNLHFWRHVQNAKRHAAKVICIDPRRTKTADKCHERSVSSGDMVRVFNQRGAYHCAALLSDRARPGQEAGHRNPEILKIDSLPQEQHDDSYTNQKSEKR
jgi:anaerobic selenocysteine-containing dehydrogenase